MNFLKDYVLVASYSVLLALSFVGSYIVLFHREDVVYEVAVPCETSQTDESCVVETNSKLFHECQSKGDITSSCLVR
jgi:hypothetical protein